MDTRKINKINKLVEIKTLNPNIKKLSKHTDSNVAFFNSQSSPFEICADGPDISSSYIFDDAKNICELHKALGKGAFGIVKRGTLLDSEQTVAIKIQNITSQIEYHYKTIKDMEKARLYVNKQIEIEDELLKLTGNFISSLTRVNLKNQEKHYSIMPYIEGVKLKEVFNTLSNHDKLKCLIQTTEQLQFLHKNNYLHLDIWRENILFNGKAILHDYGCSAKLENGEYLSKLKGSHIPPEVIQSYKKNKPCTYGVYSDIYGLGMTFYELLYDEYYNYDLDNSLDNFAERYGKYYTSVRSIVNSKNDLLSQTINNMININPENRISSDNVLNNLNLMKDSNDLQIILNCSSQTSEYQFKYNQI
jgi:serine/threonine protein kinase